MECKRFILIVALFLIIQHYGLHAQLAYSDISPDEKTMLLSEAWDNNTNNWITDNNWVKGTISDGFFQITCKNFKQQSGLSYISVPLELNSDFEIETSFKIESGTGALVFGLAEDFEHYRIEIDSKKNLFIIRDYPSKGKFDKLFSGKTGLVNGTGDFNKITIRKISSKWYFYINDIFFRELSNLSLKSNLTGFSVGVNSSIVADYLTVSAIKIKAEPLIAAKQETASDTRSPEKVLPAVNQAPDSTKPVEIKPVAVIPEITWISPSGTNTSLETYTARVRAKVKSGSELQSALFYVNGSSKGEGEVRSSLDEPGSFIIEKTVDFTPGSNTIYLIATNTLGSTKSNLRYFTNPMADPPEIKWGNPVNANSMVNTEVFNMEVCIKSLAELTSAQVLVDGVQVSVAKVFQKSDLENCSYVWKPQIVLKEGDNSIFIIAENIAGSTTSENRIIRFSKTGSEKRLALIFGNSDYANGTSLKNPVNDANLVEATLKELNFEVLKHTNAGKAEMEKALVEFTQKLPSYNVALFYYAGHGIQVDGVNYLIPTDAVIEEKTSCKWEAISVSDIVGEFEKYPDNINIVILDACRNNPYRSWVRGNEAGFRFISDVSGTIIAYATAEGATAADGSGANGLYTEELVKQMLITQPVESVFKKTRVQVEQKSKGMQSPRESSGLRGEFYFKR
jgi:hypothetical protein